MLKQVSVRCTNPKCSGGREYVIRSGDTGEWITCSVCKGYGSITKMVDTDDPEISDYDGLGNSSPFKGLDKFSNLG